MHYPGKEEEMVDARSPFHDRMTWRHEELANSNRPHSASRCAGCSDVHPPENLNRRYADGGALSERGATGSEPERARDEARVAGPREVPDQLLGAIAPGEESPRKDHRRKISSNHDGVHRVGGRWARRLVVTIC